jgi:hypothetical protein
MSIGIGILIFLAGVLIGGVLATVGAITAMEGY